MYPTRSIPMVKPIRPIYSYIVPSTRNEAYPRIIIIRPIPIYYKMLNFEALATTMVPTYIDRGDSYICEIDNIDIDQYCDLKITVVQSSSVIIKNNQLYSCYSDVRALRFTWGYGNDIVYKANVHRVTEEKIPV